MSLQPNAVDLCQASSLQDRRRSSVSPQTVPPLLLTSSDPPPNQTESPVADEDSPPEYPCTAVSPAATHLISPISNAHVSAQSSSFSTSRHHDALSIHKSDLAISPSGSALNSDSYFEPEITQKKNLRLRWRLASTLVLYFLNGWADGVTGTALPYFRTDFHLSYMISSLLFVGNLCGFVVGTLLVPSVVNFLGLFPLTETRVTWAPMSPWRVFFSGPSDTLGHSPSKARYLVLIIFDFCLPATFIMMGSKQGLPTMFMAYFMVSFGRAITTASLNVFLSEGRSKYLGYGFGVWSLGSVVSPFIFQVVVAAGVPWTHFYFGSLVPAAANIVFLAITFFPTTHEFATDHKKAMADADSRARRSPLFDTKEAPDDYSSGTLSQTPSPPNALRLVSSMPYHWAVAVFSLLYYGSETTTQGLASFSILDALRSIQVSSPGYTISPCRALCKSEDCWICFLRFLGWNNNFALCLELFLAQHFIHPPKMDSTRLSVSLINTHPIRNMPTFYSRGLALGMHVLIWFINSNLENAVSASLIGLFFGPTFPACLELATDLLPAEVHMISMAIINATGSLGSGIFPFITSVVTTKYGMRCWSYTMIAQGAIIFGIWFLFPTRQPPRRTVAL
ncbi:hypothetical protein DFH06DRAFT_1413366 [Mycena polygramma]|nr:hypothetical protein DFH06DRAFT_1413366 [Mycena polygramma]